MAARFDELLEDGAEEGQAPSFEDLASEDGVQVKEAPGVLRTFGRHLRQGLNPLWDEGAGVVGAGVDSFRHLRETGNVVSPHEWLEGYRRNRDESRDTDLRGSQANPVAAASGKVTGALGGGLVAGGTGGLGGGALRAVTSGATQGAAQGLASSEADLTHQDAEAYARAFRDTLTGGAAGAAFGGLGYGAGKGLQWVGDKARGLYRAGREELADSVREARWAEEDKLAAKVAKEEKAFGKEQGKGMEDNKAFNARAAREEAKRVARAAREEAKRVARAAREEARRVAQEARGAGRRPSPAAQQAALPDEPGTRTLGGYEGQAHGARKTNEARVEADRARLARPDLSPEQRQVAQRYVDKYADAVDDPYGYIRRTIEENLRRAGYPRDMVDRIMRERVGPGGEILPRRQAVQPTPEQPLLPERTQIQDAGDWARRGQPERAGGGGSAWQDYGPDARTVSANVADARSPSFTAEEVAARRRHGAEQPPDAWRAWREWEVADQTQVEGLAPPAAGMRRLFRVEGVEPGGSTAPVRGHQWFTDRIGVADEQLHLAEGGNGRMVYLDVPEAEARRMLAVNRSPPRFARSSGDMGREWAVPNKVAKKSQPLPVAREPVSNLEDLDGAGLESSGTPQWNRGVDGPFWTDEALEPTSVGARPVQPEPSPGRLLLPPAPAAPVRAADPFHDARTRVGLIKTADHGDVWDFEFRDPKTGRDYFVKLSREPTDPAALQMDIIRPKDMTTGEAITDGWERERNGVGPSVIRQIYAEIARAFPGVKRLTAYRATGWNEGRDIVQRLPEVTAAGEPSFGPTDGFAQRRLQSEGQDGLYRNWPEGEPTANDAMPRGEYEGVEFDLPPPAEIADPTQVGWPSFPPDVQRAAPLASRPALRPGQPYAPVGAPRRSSLPPEDVLAAEEAMAARRAAAAGSGPSGPALEATSGARPRAMAPEASTSMRAPRDGTGPLPDDVTRTAPRWEGGRLPPRPPMSDAPEATQAGQPSAFTERTRYAPPSVEQRLGGRDSVEDAVNQRLAGAGRDVRDAFVRGASGEGAVGFGLAGIALDGISGGLWSLGLRGGFGVVREAIKNPAVRVRAISALRLARLAAIRPEVWGRVSATLSRAAQLDAERGTDHHLKAARHVLLQRDPEFRAADAQAAEEVQRMDDDALARRLSAGR